MKTKFEYLIPIEREVDIDFGRIYDYLTAGLEPDEDLHEAFVGEFDEMMYDLFDMDMDRCTDFYLFDKIMDGWMNFLKQNEV